METTKKFTLRYESDIEKLLNDSIKDSSCNTMNSFIIHLIKLALVENPATVKNLKKEKALLNEELLKAQKQLSTFELKHEQLVTLLKNKAEIEEAINRIFVNKKQ